MGRGRPLAALAACLALAVLLGDGAAAARTVHGGGVSALPAVVPGKLIVGFRSGVGPAGQRRALARAGAVGRRRLGSDRVRLVTVAARAGGRARSLLAGDPRVRYVEPDRLITIDAPAPAPNDPLFGSQWGLENTGQLVGFTPGTAGADIAARQAWSVTTGSSSVTVGIVDTGIDLSHPDLAGNLWINPGENCPGCRNDGIDNDHNGYVDDWRGWDFANNDNDPSDDNGHGTHVAGIVGAVAGNGAGVAGVSPVVRLMPLKFIGADGTGDVAGAVQAIRYATAMGAQITNNSWGDDQYSQALTDAIADADAHGDLFVAAAGNDANDNDSSPRYPANVDLPNVLSVAASDNADQLASFSDYGAGTVDLAAPGVNIVSTWPGGGYRTLSGTSMAAPFASGTAALALAAHPGASAAGLRTLLDGTADHPAGLNGATGGGGRRLDAGAALGCSGTPQLVIDTPGPGFLALPGQPTAVRVLAGACGGSAGLAVTGSVNGQPLALSARGDGVFTGSFVPAGSGSTTVSATASTAAGSASDSVTGSTPVAVSPGGPPVTVITSGEDERLVFDAPAGTRVAAQLTGSTIALSTISVREPDGSQSGSRTVGTGTSFLDAIALQQPGVHTLVVHPFTGASGSITVQLLAVPADAAATLVAGGAAATLTVAAPGQNAVATFSGQAGHRVSVAYSGSVSFMRTSLLGPGGTALAGPAYSGGGGFVEPVRLPRDGTYTVLFDPQDARTGTVTATLYDVPDDPAPPLQAGVAGTVNLSVPGQNASFTFAGTAGRRASFALTSTVSLMRTTVLSPDGSTLSGPLYSGSGSAFIDARTLPQTGSYRVLADPQDSRTGSVTITAYDVPADASAAIGLGGPSATVTTTVPGQNAAVSFAGIAGHAATVTYATSGLGTPAVSLLAPDGSVVARGSVGLIDHATLPSSGQYTVAVDPSGPAVGSATVGAIDVPPDLNAAIVPGGAPLQLSLAASQNASVTFTGSAGGRLSLNLAGSSLPSTRLDLRAPDGSLVATLTAAGSGGFLDTRTLPLSGTYTIAVDPAGSTPVSLTLIAYDVPADATATAVPGGPAATLPLAVPGQNGAVTFSGALGQRVSLRVAMSIPARLVLRRPDGTAQVTTQASTTTFVDVITLPAAGGWSLLVDPIGAAAGTVAVNVYDVPADVTGTLTQGGAPLTVAMPVPGQGARLSWTAAAGQSTVLKLAAVGPALKVSVLRPDGTVLLSPSWVFGSGQFAITAAVAGTYTIVLDPYDSQTGNATVSLL